MNWLRIRTVVYRLALLALLAGIGDRAMSYAFGKLLVRSQWRYSILYRGGNHAGVVIIGNSRGVNGFYAPAAGRALGKPVINLSYNGLSLRLGAALARDWVDHNGKPEMIVAEVTGMRMKNNAIQDLKPYWYLSPRLEQLARREAPDSLRWTTVSHLLAFNSEMFFRALTYLRHSDQDWINRYRVNAALIAETRRMEPGTFETTDDNLDALRELVAYCHDNGIALRLVVTPFLPGYVDHIENYHAWVAQIESVSGLPVWDYSNADSDTSHFSDRLHANFQGAELFMSRLVSAGFFDPQRRAP